MLFSLVVRPEMQSEMRSPLPSGNGSDIAHRAPASNAVEEAASASTSRSFHRPPLTLSTLLYLTWTLLLGVTVMRSWSWPMVHDTPLLQYVAWLIDRGMVPYRDLFEMNLPGTYGIHWLGIRLFGSDAQGLRYTDTLWLALTMCAAAGVVRLYGKWASMTAALLLATLYLMGGPLDAMQRDYLLLAPLFGAIALIPMPHQRPTVSVLYALCSGLLLGISALIKPQTLVLLAPMSLYIVWTKKDALRTSLPFLGLGFSLPLIISYWLLKQTGALPHFAWQWQHYLGPLYSHLDGDGIEYPPGTGLYFWSTTAMLEGLTVPSRLALCGAGALGVWKSLELTSLSELRLRPGSDALQNQTSEGQLPASPDALKPEPKAASESPSLSPHLLLLLCLSLFGLMHVVIGVKQWWYHWWPFYGASVLLISLLGRHSLWRILLPLYGITVLSIAVWTQPHLADAQSRMEPVSRLASTLKRIAAPGDRLQVLDTVGGGVHAALLAKLEPGSSFLYDFHFFHHPESTTTHILRQRLMDELTNTPPRFVVVWRKSWSHRMTFEAIETFPALTAFLAEQYDMIEETVDYRLLERRASTSGLRPPPASHNPENQAQPIPPQGPIQ